MKRIFFAVLLGLGVIAARPASARPPGGRFYQKCHDAFTLQCCEVMKTHPRCVAARACAGHVISDTCCNNKDLDDLYNDQKCVDLRSKAATAALSQQPGGAAQVQAAQTNNAALVDAEKQAVIAWMSARTAAAKVPFCYRRSDDRGVGKPLSTCNSDQQKDGLLCYPKCNDGYGGAGPACWHTCPSGYTDTGAFCHIDKALTKSGSWSCPHWYSCHKVCPAGYTNAGLFCALTTPSTPAGWKGDGLDLIKDTYTRGAGSPMGCAAGEEEDAALCYSKCSDGYHGVGPVCWQNCLPEQTECGVGCAASKEKCGTNTADMVVSPLMLAVNILTFGASSEIEEAQAGIKSSLAAKDMSGAKAAFGRYLEASVSALEKMTTKEVVDTLGKKFSENAAKWCAKEFVKVQYYMAVKQSSEDQANALAKDMMGLDPTGVGGVVAAYANPKCAPNEPFPDVHPLY